MSFKVSVLAAAATTAAFFVGPAQAQVVNGNFDGPSGGMATTYVSGWNVGGNVDVKPTATWASNAAWSALLAAKPGSGVAGDQFLDLSGNTPGMITQQLGTTAGTTYHLSFDYAANVWSGPNTASFVVSLYWGSGGVHQVLNGGSTWNTGHIDFTPEGQTTLAFMSLTPQDAPDSPEKRSGALLDNVVVNPLGGVNIAALNGPVPLNGFNDPVAAVPEPETYAMMLLGLAAVGFVTRRRQQAQKNA